MNSKVKAVLDILAKKLPQEAMPRPLSEIPKIQVHTFSTQSIIVDRLLGRGGWPRGHMVELYGREGSGKTTFCYHAIAQAQKEGMLCAMLDAEHRTDPDYASKIGVDLSSLIFLQPMRGEDGMEAIRQLLHTKKVGLIIVDSIDAIRPEVEDENDFDSSNIGKHAKLINSGLRQFSKLKGAADCCLIFTNQIRKDPSGYGSGEVNPGGMAPKFYCSIRVKLSRTETNKNKAEEAVSNTVKVKTEKNSVGVPYKEAEITLEFGVGICPYNDAITAGIEAGLIKKKGSFYSLVHGKEEIKLGQGIESAKLWLKTGSRLAKLQALIRKSKWYLEGIGKFEAVQEKSPPSVETEPAEDGEVSPDGGGGEEEESEDGLSGMRTYFLKSKHGPSSPEGEDGEEYDDSDSSLP